MASNKWDTIDIDTSEGRVKGIAPIIISASRSTDIPAFYSEWFINRLKEGYVKWINPFNGKPQYVSFHKTRVIVFWTKDVEPIIPHLKEIDSRRINYYFTFTINDYEKEGFELGVRRLDRRIDTFKRLSEKIGKEKMIWRFDPLIITDKINVEALLDKIAKIGNGLPDYTNKLVISFADISAYRNVQNNLRKNNVNYIEFTPETMEAVAKGLYEINKDWKLEIATCSEGIDLSRYNIKKNKCIDDDLMINVFSDDKELMDFLDYDNIGSTTKANEQIQLNFIENTYEYILGKNADNSFDRWRRLKDKGQRECCGCIISKDIGQYDTCSHHCIYCYANKTPHIAKNNYQRYLKSNKNGESII